MGPLVVIVATLAIQGILLSITFPLTQLWTPVPLLYNDNAYHLYQMKLAHAFAQAGTLVGYDPQFTAGYPGGILFNWSAKVPWLFAAALDRWVDNVVLYKVYVFLCGVLGPVWIPVALRRLGANAPSMALGAALAVTLWWASWFHWMFTEGMVSFVTGSYLSVPYLVEIMRYLEGEGGFRRLSALGVAGAALFFLHPLFPVPIAIGTLVCILLTWPHVASKRLLLLVLVVPALSLLPNIPWLVAMRQYADLQKVTAYFNVVDVHVIWKELIGVYHTNVHGSKAYAVIGCLTFFTLLLLRRPPERRRMQVFALLGLVLIVVAAVGGAVPILRSMQPNRFGPAGYLFLVIPAAFALAAMRNASRADGSKTLLIVARITMIPLAAVGAYCLYEVLVEVSDVNLGHYAQRPPQVQPVSERALCVTQWLERHTTRQGRLLFEVSPAQGRGSELAYYAYKTDREFLGGPMPEMFFSSFVYGRLFGRQIGSIGEERFMEYMELYNVGWIVAHRAETKRALERFPRVVEAGQCKNLTTYRVERPLSYFLKGRGVVAVDEFNNLVLDGLEGDSIVLSYNYVQGLKSTPAVEIEPVALMNGLPPFIRLVAPPHTVRLHLGR